MLFDHEKKVIADAVFRKSEHLLYNHTKQNSD